MSINQVNGIGNYSTSFKGKEIVQPKEGVLAHQTQGVSDTFEKQEKTKMSTGKKVAIGAAVIAVVATAAALIYKAKKGKPISVDSFRELGNKFENGIALNADGSRFTGNLSHTNSNGDRFVIEYVNGELTRSIKNPSGKKGVVNLLNGNYIKEYTRNAEGKLTNIKQTTQQLDGYENIKETIFDNNKIIQREDGELIKSTATPSLKNAMTKNKQPVKNVLETTKAAEPTEQQAEDFMEEMNKRALEASRQGGKLSIGEKNEIASRHNLRPVFDNSGKITSYFQQPV